MRGVVDEMRDLSDQYGRRNRADESWGGLGDREQDDYGERKIRAANIAQEVLVIRSINDDPVHAESREVVVKGAWGELLLDSDEEAEKRHRPEAQANGRRNARCRGSWIGGADQRYAFDGVTHSRRPSGFLAEATIGDTKASSEHLPGRTRHYPH